MIILNVILALVLVSAVASIVNLFSSRYNSTTDSIPMKVQLPGNLPIISLSNSRGDVMNFLLDSGSNISHICAEYFCDLDTEITSVYNNSKIEGLGSTNIGITMCTAVFHDIIGNSYNINLSVSKELTAVATSIESETGVKIHGLLGTDFLKKYNYVMDFKSFKVYSR